MTQQLSLLLLQPKLDTSNGWHVLDSRHEFHRGGEVRGAVTYLPERFEPWHWTAITDNSNISYAGTSPSCEEAQDAVEFALGEE